jgi:hypothetical protein
VELSHGGQASREAESKNALALTGPSRPWQRALELLRKASIEEVAYQDGKRGFYRC